MGKSINKTTVIIVLAVFLTLSIGYALFSDTITIEGTATAQGNFDMTLSAQFGYPDVFEEAVSMYYTTEEKGYKDGNLIINGNKLTYDVAFEYPGSKRFVTVKVTNSGTITAKIDFTNMLTHNWNLCIDGYNGELNGSFEENECSNEVGNLINSDLGNKFVGFESSEGVIAPNTNEANASFLDYLITGTSAKLEPGESVYFVFENSFTYDNKSIFYQKIQPDNFNVKETGTFEFEFEQYNG